MTDTIVVEAGTCADAVLEGDVAKETHPDARGRGVANAHLTDREDLTAFCDAVIHQIAANLNGTIELLLTHGGLVEEVLGASGYLAVDDTINLREVVVDADIDDAKLEAVLAAEHVDASATTSEVDHLLPGDLTRRHADTLTLNAVVTAKQQVTGMG